jgi:hypothetical protein
MEPTPDRCPSVLHTIGHDVTFVHCWPLAQVRDYRRRLEVILLLQGWPDRSCDRF